MENKFTQKAQSALTLAALQAQNLGHTYIGSEHLLLGLIEERECIASRMLSKKGITYLKIKNDVISQTEIGKRTSLSSKDLSPRVKKIIENSMRLCEKNKQNMIGSEHLLYSLLGENDCLAVRVLEQNGIYVHEMQSDILSFISSSPRQGKSNDKRRDEKSFDIESFARNLNNLASLGKIDPTLCREKETERIIQILLRRTKNNPCLIGEPGVGKTAVVEGLAARIENGNVPLSLKGKTIYSLDLSSLIAGAKYRGEFEERMKSLMNECIKNPNIILFVDEIHTIIGAGSAEGAIDAASILKPALARGEIQIIGATTIKEYRKYIEKDSALERRFQPVNINEPSAKEAEKILFGLRERYEMHHGIRIEDDAIRAAIKLSTRYINDRFLPDKAIDLIDEASSRASIEVYSSLNSEASLENELAKVRGEKEEALALKSIAKLKELSTKEKQIEHKISNINNETALDSSYNDASINYESIANVVTDWTGIPISRLLEGESKRLLTLEETLKKRIIGQDNAVELVSQAIRRARIGLKNADKPTGSFIFIGPTGVGKTELCLALAETLFDSRQALIRLDMSEYMEKHSISRLIGAPPGYVGYDEGGILSERVRTNPYSIVLFDEIEKAHPEIFNLLLQILEDGTLTDSHGRLISFKNALIIMTPNLGSNEVNSSSSLGFFTPNDEKSNSIEREKKIKKALERTFKPEFLNRVDEIIIFNSLTDTDIENICSIMLFSLSERLKQIKIDVSFTDGAKELIVANANDKKSGARNLRREIRRLVENPLSEEILAKNINEYDSIIVDAQNGKIAFKK